MKDMTAPPKHVLVLGVAIALFAAYPYAGIVHDGRLYALQALFRLHPGVFDRDIFFLYGSQEQFTVFGRVYAAAIRWIGLDAASLVVTLVGEVSVVSAAVFLFFRLARGSTVWAGAFLLCSLPVYYGASHMLGLIEPFATARPYAEALGLLGLGLLLDGRTRLAWPALIAAGLFHPLMAMGTAATAVLYSVRRVPVLVAIACAAGSVAVSLAWLGLAPFSGLFQSMDADWLAVTRVRSPFLFLDLWSLSDWNSAVLVEALLAAAWLDSTGRLRRFWFAAIVVTAGSLLVSWLGTVFFHNVLIIQLQLWRMTWLGGVLACLAVALLAAPQDRWSEARRLTVLGFAAAWLLREHAGGAVAVAALSFWIWQIRSDGSARPSPMVRWAIYVLTLQAVIWAVLGAVAKTRFQLGLGGVSYGAWAADGLVPVLGFWLWYRIAVGHHGWLKKSAAAAALLLLALFAFRWGDEAEKLQWKRTAAEFSEFENRVPAGSIVYWADSPLHTWFALGRPNYVSRVQMAGIVFSRATALEAQRRAGRLAGLGVLDADLVWEHSSLSDSATATAEGVAAACQDRLLDFVVLAKRFDRGLLAEHVDSSTGVRYYLYACDRWSENRMFSDTRVQQGRLG